MSEPHINISNASEPHTRNLTISEPNTHNVTVSRPHIGNSCVSEPQAPRFTPLLREAHSYLNSIDHVSHTKLVHSPQESCHITDLNLVPPPIPTPQPQLAF